MVTEYFLAQKAGYGASTRESHGNSRGDSQTMIIIIVVVIIIIILSQCNGYNPALGITLAIALIGAFALYAILPKMPADTDHGAKFAPVPTHLSPVPTHLSPHPGPAHPGPAHPGPHPAYHPAHLGPHPGPYPAHHPAHLGPHPGHHPSHHLVHPKPKHPKHAKSVKHAKRPKSATHAEDSSSDSDSALDSSSDDSDSDEDDTAAAPQVAGSQVAEPQVAEPQVAGSQAAGSQAAGSQAAGSQAATRGYPGHPNSPIYSQSGYRGAIDTEDTGYARAPLTGFRDRTLKDNDNAPLGNKYNTRRVAIPTAADMEFDDEANDTPMDGSERMVYQAFSRNDPLRPKYGLMNLRANLDGIFREDVGETEESVWWGQHEY